MTAILLLLALFLPQADPLANSTDKTTLQQQVWSLRKMHSRKSQLTPAELAQEQKVHAAMNQKQRQLDAMDSTNAKAQFLKEHPECATKNPKCVPAKVAK